MRECYYCKHFGRPAGVFEHRPLFECAARYMINLEFPVFVRSDGWCDLHEPAPERAVPGSAPASVPA